MAAETTPTATAAEILRGCDPDDRAGNIGRLMDAGFEQSVAQREAVIYATRIKNGRTADGREETDRETAAQLARGAELFHTPDAIAYASITVDGHREHVPVRSRRFKSWLTLQFRARKGKAPSADAINTAQIEAEAVADLEGPQREVYTRVAFVDGRVYVDLCDDAWRVIEVDATGWRVLDSSPVPFTRPADALPLPEPVRGGSLDALRPFVNAPGDHEWDMLRAWLIGAMAPTGPYPLLNLLGEQGSAKSTTSRRLRSVIDPTRTATRETPRNSHDLAIAAKRCRVLAFDNLSWLSSDMSDALCRLATGGGFAVRRLYTDDEESTFYATRPVILNGIGDVATRGDLLDRAIIVHLPTLETVRDEREMNAEWEAAHPAILGALLDAVSAALAGWESVDLGRRAPRMADFARWVVASGAVPGFLDRYAENRADAVATELESSPFAAAVIAFATTHGRWSGTAGDLLRGLEASGADTYAKTWPKDATRAGAALRRHAPALRRQGIGVAFRRTSGRKVIELEAPQSDDARIELR